jgi:glucosamine-6-phosphate deaminase
MSVSSFDQIERIGVQVFGDAADVSRAVARQIAELIRARLPSPSAACSAWRPARRPPASTPSWCACTARRTCPSPTSSRSTSTNTSPCHRTSCKATCGSCTSTCSTTSTSPRRTCTSPMARSKRRGGAPTARTTRRRSTTPGGIDLQLLGIGRTGHIGFNEPGSDQQDSRTRMIWLDKLTRLDAASDFFGIDNVPQRAITMGVGTILDAAASC